MTTMADSDVLSISIHELLSDEQINLFRAALSAGGWSQREFCDQHDLKDYTLSKALNRKLVPPKLYAEAMEELMRSYVEDMRFIIDRLDDEA